MTIFLTQQLLFIHVPKTAGTTVRHFLESHFAPDAIFPSEEAMERDPAVYRRIEHATIYPKSLIRQALLVRSHIPYPDIVPLLDLQPAALTMLRDPIRRAISEIRHHQRADPQLAPLSLEEMILQQPDSYLPSWSYFGRSVEEAIKTVQTFDWLGVQEQFAASMEMLCTLMGWAAPPEWNNENTMPDRQREAAISMRALELLSDRLYDDIRFYMAGREEFEKRLARSKRAVKAA